MRMHITVIDDKGKHHEGTFVLTVVKSKTTDVKKITKTKQFTIKQIPEKTVKLIAKNLDELKISSLVLLALKFCGPLTRTQQEEMLKGWGKKIGKDLRGGNYKRDLLSKGLVHETGKIGREPIYELTARGNIETEKVFKGLSSKKNG